MTKLRSFRICDVHYGGKMDQILWKICMHAFRLSVLFVFAFTCFTTPSWAQSLRPADVLERLRRASNSQDPCLGQNIGHSDQDMVAGYRRWFEPLLKSNNYRLHVLGMDLGFERLRLDDDEFALAVDHARRGGVVTISMHPRNPWRSTDSHDVENVNPVELFQHGTAANIRWSGMVDQLARTLKRLKSENVAVLFRPFHEMNGGWFWWGGSQAYPRFSSEEFVRLWRELHQELAVRNNLDNLIWVYSPSVQYEAHREFPVMHYYPGDDVVDVVGLDFYGNDVSLIDRNRSYSALQQTKKPFAFCEFGPSQNDHSYNLASILTETRTQFPNTAYILFWHSWDERKMAVVELGSSD